MHSHATATGDAAQIRSKSWMLQDKPYTCKTVYMCSRQLKTVLCLDLLNEPWKNKHLPHARWSTLFIVPHIVKPGNGQLWHLAWIASQKQLCHVFLNLNHMTLKTRCHCFLHLRSKHSRIGPYLKGHDSSHLHRILALLHVQDQRIRQSGLDGRASATTWGAQYHAILPPILLCQFWFGTRNMCFHDRAINQSPYALPKPLRIHLMCKGPCGSIPLNHHPHNRLWVSVVPLPKAYSPFAAARSTYSKPLRTCMCMTYALSRHVQEFSALNYPSLPPTCVIPSSHK